MVQEQQSASLIAVFYDFRAAWTAGSPRFVDDLDSRQNGRRFTGWFHRMFGTPKVFSNK